MSSVLFVVWVSGNSRLTVASGVSSSRVSMEERSEHQPVLLRGLNPEAEHVSVSITSESVYQAVISSEGHGGTFFLCSSHRNLQVSGPRPA